MSGRAIGWRRGSRCCRCGCCSAVGWRLKRPLAGQLQTQLRLQVQLCIVHDGLPPAEAVPQDALRRVASHVLIFDDKVGELAGLYQLCV